MKFMEIGNDRLYLAIRSLLFGEGDVRSRVVAACQIINKMSRNEIDHSLRLRLDALLIKASKKAAILNADGNVLTGYDKFEVTAKHSQNRTYVSLAKDMYQIYLDDLSVRDMAKRK
ncbi:hypothetical protein [Polynucleobacter sp. 80A-SIGWE]|uniref:hypothetical protein n=1 Tax=Polynucleobacter sp. 80A-SIGWE TaxID=2689100 RepID=UPI001C0E670A|nr:hypothetical protein [Polynucleobacter sp. 80A-SIGWE]MBU3588521.1 hypothetical protein [Polynucleobacter sp. 80A-SIGWE]